MIRARLGALARLATMAAAVAVVAVAPAHAGAASGMTALALNGPAAESLRDAGIRIGPLRPARGGPRRLVLPIAAGLAGSDTTLLRHRGGIALRGAEGRRVLLTKLRLTLGRRAQITAISGSDEIDLFRVLRGGRRTIDQFGGTVTLAGVRLKLTRGAARLIARRLLPPLDRDLAATWTTKPIGEISVRARGLLAAGDAPPADKAGDGGGASEVGCPLPSGAGPAPEDPLPAPTRPPGAVEVTAATIDWHVRESFIRYINTGEGTSVSGGASADPPLLLPGASVPLSYGFHFPFAQGWLDPGANLADPADDTAAIEFDGAVRFLYSGHEIDLSTADPEIEIGPDKSRAIFTISESGGAAERQLLINLDLSRAGRVAVGGNTHTYERVPGAVPAGTASSVFAGFYAPGTEFGCVSVSFQTGS